MNVPRTSLVWYVYQHSIKWPKCWQIYPTVHGVITWGSLVFHPAVIIQWHTFGMPATPSKNEIRWSIFCSLQGNWPERTAVKQTYIHWVDKMWNVTNWLSEVVWLLHGWPWCSANITTGYTFYYSFPAIPQLMSTCSFSVVVMILSSKVYEQLQLVLSVYCYLPTILLMGCIVVRSQKWDSAALA